MTNKLLVVSKKALAAAHKAFAANPSATNWRHLEDAMTEHQYRHHMARHAAAMKCSEAFANI